MQTGALIAAAGKHDAMEENRALLMMNGTSLIQKEIDLLRQADVSPIVVVTGDRAEELEHHLAHRGVICLRNERYASTQMLDSVKLGLNYLQIRCERVLFLPVHAPLFSVGSLLAVMRETAPVVVPSHGGKAGHPILLSSRVIPHVLAYEGGGGLRGALDSWDGEKVTVEVDDPGIALQIGSAEEYRRALDYERETLSRHSLRLSVRLTMGREEDFFGPGIAELLEGIEREGSLLAACKAMGMSYSKGWKKLKALEEGMGYPFLIRKTGGADGGNSRLTDRGRDFLNRFRSMERDVKRMTEECFQNYFPEEQ